MSRCSLGQTDSFVKFMLCLILNGEVVNTLKLLLVLFFQILAFEARYIKVYELAPLATEVHPHTFSF